MKESLFRMMMGMGRMMYVNENGVLIYTLKYTLISPSYFSTSPVLYVLTLIRYLEH